MRTVELMTTEAAKRGSDLVLFPELWSTGYDLANAADYATSLSDGIFLRTAALAKANNIQILGSCMSIMDDGGYGNTAVLFSADGQLMHHYSKIHLFCLMDEEKYLSAGERLAMVDAQWGRAGLAICYDLRFPELFRAYALAGAQLIFLPSEWPHPRLAHWQTLLRARAIENQMFLVACNRVGVSGDTAFFGHSCVIDPWGEVVIEGGESEILLTADIDLEQVNAVRSKIPIFADRRPELYAAPIESSKFGAYQLGE